MNEEKYKSALNNLNVSKDFKEKTLAFLQGKSVKTIKKSILIKNSKFKKIFGVAAVIVSLVVIIWGMSFYNSNSFINLANSTGNIRAKYVNRVPLLKAKKESKYSIAVMPSEYEIFNEHNISIFKGTVKDIKNIKLEFGNSNEYYQAVVTIKIDEVYRGSNKTGSIVKVLLPCSIDTNNWVEDTDVVSKMKVGTIGIFMPTKYDGTEYKEENGAKLYWKDISNYGFRDGISYAFLKTPKGIIYDEFIYKSLNKISTLNDVKEYVLKMMKPNK